MIALKQELLNSNEREKLAQEQIKNLNQRLTAIKKLEKVTHTNLVKSLKYLEEAKYEVIAVKKEAESLKFQLEVAHQIIEEETTKKKKEKEKAQMEFSRIQREQKEALERQKKEERERLHRIEEEEKQAKLGRYMESKRLIIA